MHVSEEEIQYHLHDDGRFCFILLSALHFIVMYPNLVLLGHASVHRSKLPPMFLNPKLNTALQRMVWMDWIYLVFFMSVL